MIWALDWTIAIILLATCSVLIGAVSKLPCSIFILHHAVANIYRLLLDGIWTQNRLKQLVVEHDRRFDRRLVPDALERLAKLLQLECLVDDALGLDLARVEVVDRLRCCCGLVSYKGRGGWVSERKGLATYGTCAPRKTTQ